jgi:hypothetical protein
MRLNHFKVRGEDFDERSKVEFHRLQFLTRITRLTVQSLACFRQLKQKVIDDFDSTLELFFAWLDCNHRYLVRIFGWTELYILSFNTRPNNSSIHFDLIFEVLLHFCSHFLDYLEICKFSLRLQGTSTLLKPLRKNRIIL